eukprot:TRINITY_DN28202_c0_g1_i1.p1 TRINITY_DN28202_c0_g1~~TRINITY_DN28202_c0_g1_i1.p1  ORF type:complete len:265 (+),score=61.13 TRINITY_DN28202_c0_g1_i1:81-875(+)
MLSQKPALSAAASAPAPQPAPQSVAYEGNLSKKAAKVGGWSQRWFSLRGPLLYYYEEKGHCDIRKGQVEIDSDAPTEILLSGRGLHRSVRLRAADEASAARWAAELTAAAALPGSGHSDPDPRAFDSPPSSPVASWSSRVPQLSFAPSRTAQLSFRPCSSQSSFADRRCEQLRQEQRQLQGQQQCIARRADGRARALRWVPLLAEIAARSEPPATPATEPSEAAAATSPAQGAEEERRRLSARLHELQAEVGRVKQRLAALGDG